MKFCEATAISVLLAAATVSSQGSYGPQDCTLDSATISRGFANTLVSPNGNVTCLAVDIFVLADNSSHHVNITNGNQTCADPTQYISLPSDIATGRAIISWSCATTKALCHVINIVENSSTPPTAISTIGISQSCGVKTTFIPGGQVSTDTSATGTIPPGTIPTGTIPTGTIPTGTIPTGTIPTGTIPTGVTNAPTQPGQTTIGAGTAPSQATTVTGASSSLANLPTGGSLATGPSNTYVDTAVPTQGTTVPAGQTATQVSGSATNPMGSGSGTSPPGQTAPPCTCNGS